MYNMDSTCLRVLIRIGLKDFLLIFFLKKKRINFLLFMASTQSHSSILYIDGVKRGEVGIKKN